MEATERTTIDNDEGLESFTSAWTSVLIDLNDKPQQCESSTDESKTEIDNATNPTKGDLPCPSTSPATQI